MKRLFAILLLFSLNLQVATASILSNDFEIGCTSNSIRGDTQINPLGQVVEVDKSHCEASIKPNLYWASDALEIEASFWLTANNDVFIEKSSDILLSDTYINWTASNQTFLKVGWLNFENGSGYAWNPSNPFFGSFM